MGAAHSSSLTSCSITHHNYNSLFLLHSSKPNPNPTSNPGNGIFFTHHAKPTKGFAFPKQRLLSFNFTASKLVSLKCGGVREMETTREDGSASSPIVDVHGINQELVQKMVYDALVWCSLHGLVVGDKSVQKSGTVPGVGLVHAPFALLPVKFPESHWKLACEVAPIFNELIDRVSLDGKFLQESLSRTKKVDAFTSRLLDIHSKMLEINKKEDIRLGLHRSDYMLDEQTKLLLQIELNTISCSFPGLSTRVSELHRNLLKHYGKHLGLHSERVPANTTVIKFAESLAKAWSEYNNSRAVILVVVQPEERNMYDQHWLSTELKETYPLCI
ncbi:Glutathione synthetase [Turnera subulata]|uniref:Glutathione synthetase n=1 Tax=Turnera subulata TaxID=218843 RepID=A0A9Q0FT60_9ROSI|nr:Glutathione synthetase [Turnera subulata]